LNRLHGRIGETHYHGAIASSKDHMVDLVLSIVCCGFEQNFDILLDGFRVREIAWMTGDPSIWIRGFELLDLLVNLGLSRARDDDSGI